MCQGNGSSTAGPEFHELLNHHQRLQKYIEEQKGHIDTTQARPRNGAVDPIHSRRDLTSISTTHSLTQTRYPVNAAEMLKAASRKQPDNVSFEPLEPTHTTASGLDHDRDDPLSRIRTTIDIRPKTSAAACVDYSGPSTGTSASTSRTNTTYDMRPSTGLTSLAMTPGDRKSASSHTHRVSEQVLRDSQAASLADEKAKAWMAQELARRRTNSIGATSIRSASRQGSVRQTEPERPQSRTGSIREGLRDYIRPRVSTDSLRSTRSEGGAGRGSAPKGGSWWRNSSLKRKGSWSSFRSAKPEDQDLATDSANRDRVMNLNRSLPPLPGLDQYKERKPAPMHISQLMNKAPTQSTNQAQPHLTRVEDSASAAAAKERRRQRRIELGEMVDIKMREGNISPDAVSPRFAAPNLVGEGRDGRTEESVKSPRHSVQGTRFSTMTTQDGSNPRRSVQKIRSHQTKGPEVTVCEVGKSSGKEKFKKRISWLWGGKKNENGMKTVEV